MNHQGNNKSAKEWYATDRLTMRVIRAIEALKQRTDPEEYHLMAQRNPNSPRQIMLRKIL